MRDLPGREDTNGAQGVPLYFYLFFNEEENKSRNFQRREENSFLVIQDCQIGDSDFTHAAKML